MAVTLPNNPLSGVVVSTELDANFAALAAKFGSITDADIAASAAISLSKLEGDIERMSVTFKVLNQAATHINGVAAVSLSAVAVDTILDIIPVPGDDSDDNWTIADVAWVCSDTGDGNTTVRIEWGEYDAAGVWQTATTPVSAFALDNAAAAEDANDEHQVNGGSTAIAYAATPRSLALMLSAQGVGTMSNTGDYLVVTVTLKRQIQAA